MKIVNLKTYKIFKERQRQEQAYRESLYKMEKATLLQELLNYHEAYLKDPHDVSITIRGHHLMEVLEERAELSELKELSQEFKNTLNRRLQLQML